MRFVVRYRGRDSLESHKVYKVYILESKPYLMCVCPTSLHMRREEKPTRCHLMIYCTYNMLNMFRALVCPSSGARDYMCVITAYGVQCLD